jgi:hypothetical protein
MLKAQKRKVSRVVLPDGSTINGGLIDWVAEPYPDTRPFWMISLKDGTLIETTGNVIVEYKPEEVEDDHKNI